MIFKSHFYQQIVPNFYMCTFFYSILFLFCLILALFWYLLGKGHIFCSRIHDFENKTLLLYFLSLKEQKKCTQESLLWSQKLEVAKMRNSKQNSSFNFFKNIDFSLSKNSTLKYSKRNWVILVGIFHKQLIYYQY